MANFAVLGPSSVRASLSGPHSAGGSLCFLRLHRFRPSPLPKLFGGRRFSRSQHQAILWANGGRVPRPCDLCPLRTRPPSSRERHRPHTPIPFRLDVGQSAPEEGAGLPIDLNGILSPGHTESLADFECIQVKALSDFRLPQAKTFLQQFLEKRAVFHLSSSLLCGLGFPAPARPSHLSQARIAKQDRRRANLSQLPVSRTIRSPAMRTFASQFA